MCSTGSGLVCSGGPKSRRTAIHSSCRSPSRPSACWRMSWRQERRSYLSIRFGTRSRTSSCAGSPKSETARGPIRSRTMRAISWVAVNVFKESVRDRVPYNLVLFAILLISCSYLIGQLTAGQDVKIIKDLGLGATAVFGLFIAIFIGIGLVSKEVERRSIYALLAKPISRPQFIVGKYAGLVLTLAVNVLVMTLALYIVLAALTWSATPEVRASWEAPGIDPQLLKALLLIFVELMLITAIALFFSTFSSPILSAAMTFGLFVAGHFNADLRNFDKVVESKTAAILARTVYHVLPDFAAFDIKTQVVHGLPVPVTYLGSTIGYGLAYIAALLLLASFIFARRDVKEVRAQAVILTR